MRLAEIFDHNGVLAQFRGEVTNRDEPIIERRVAVSTIPTEQWPDIVGTVPWSPTPAWSGQVSNRHGGTFYLNAHDWKEETLRVPVPAPSRGGRQWRWKWEPDAFAARNTRGWVREYYPLCRECNKRHAPDKCEYE